MDCLYRGIYTCPTETPKLLFQFINYLSCTFFSVDATASTCVARYVNDAPPKDSNCVMKKVLVTEGPNERLCLFANKDIKSGTEIRYDYGVGNELPWRRVCMFVCMYVCMYD